MPIRYFYVQTYGEKRRFAQGKEWHTSHKNVVWFNNIAQLVDEIVVVDNGSTDKTLEILRTCPKVVSIDHTKHSSRRPRW